MSEDLVDVVVRTVDLQTTPVQPDQIPGHKIVMHLSGHGNCAADAVREALDEAVDEGRLEQGVVDGEQVVWIPEGVTVEHGPRND